MRKVAADQAQDPKTDPSPEPFGQLDTDDGTVFTLTHSESIIGRAREADVVIAKGEVSRMHASIERVGEKLQLLDLGSTNGTRWNGVRVAFDPVNLTDGDVVSLGETVHLTFRQI